MPRLVVNPDSPGAWVIQLKPGVNLIGRGTDTDFRVPDDSISTAHCEIAVSDRTVVIKDLGSTNGTFVSDEPVSEAVLHGGQAVRLGDVEMVFYLDGPPVPRQAAAGRAAVVAAPARVGASAPTAVQAPPSRPIPAGTAPTTEGARNCRSHPGVAARYFCNTCRHGFCDLCVNTRGEGPEAKKYCRACGSACTPVLMPRIHGAAPKKSPAARLAGSFAYPFSGDGIFLLLGGTLLYSLMDAASYISQFALMYGLIAILIMTVLGTGYLLSYLQSILTSSAVGEKKMPDWPEISEPMSDIVVPLMHTLGTLLASFLPAITVRAVFGSSHPAGAALTLIAYGFGFLYLPMAFLAVTMYGSIMAVNPLLVIPSIFRVRWAYLVTVALTLSVLAAKWSGTVLLGRLVPVPMVFPILGNFLSLCLLTVLMRMLGLLYLTKKEELGWFSR
jgi:hypothetical protein